MIDKYKNITNQLFGQIDISQISIIKYKQKWMFSIIQKQKSKKKSIWSKGFNWLINNTYNQIPSLINSYQIKNAKPQYLYFQDYIRSPDLARQAGLLSIRQLRNDYIKRKQGIEQSVSQFKKLKSINRTSFEQLVCPICLEILNAPVTTTCSHTFCHMCLDQAILFNPNCPVCRTQIRGQQMVVSKSIQKIIINTIKKVDYEDLKKYIQKQQQYQKWHNMRNLSKKQIDIGDCIDVRDTQFVWCRATIKQIYPVDCQNQSSRESILVHYEGWAHIYDQVIKLDCQRLARYKFYTSRIQIPHYNLSDDNNQHLRSAVVIGQNRMDNRISQSLLNEILQIEMSDDYLSNSDHDQLNQQQQMMEIHRQNDFEQIMARSSSLNFNQRRLARFSAVYNEEIINTSSWTSVHSALYQNSVQSILSNHQNSLVEQQLIQNQFKDLDEQIQELKHQRIKYLTKNDLFTSFKHRFEIGDQWKNDHYYPAQYFQNVQHKTQQIDAEYQTKFSFNLEQDFEDQFNKEYEQFNYHFENHLPKRLRDNHCQYANKNRRQIKAQYEHKQNEAKNEIQVNSKNAQFDEKFDKLNRYQYLLQEDDENLRQMLDLFEKNQQQQQKYLSKQSKQKFKDSQSFDLQSSDQQDYTPQQFSFTKNKKQSKVYSQNRKGHKRILFLQDNNEQFLDNIELMIKQLQRQEKSKTQVSLGSQNDIQYNLNDKQQDLKDKQYNSRLNNLQNQISHFKSALLQLLESDAESQQNDKHKKSWNQEQKQKTTICLQNPQVSSSKNNQCKPQKLQILQNQQRYKPLAQNDKIQTYLYSAKLSDQDEQEQKQYQLQQDIQACQG